MDTNLNEIENELMADPGFQAALEEFNSEADPHNHAAIGEDESCLPCDFVDALHKLVGIKNHLYSQPDNDQEVSLILEMAPDAKDALRLIGSLSQATTLLQHLIALASHMLSHPPTEEGEEGECEG